MSDDPIIDDAMVIDDVNGEPVATRRMGDVARIQFRPERVFVSATGDDQPSGWIINDIRIGNVTAFDPAVDFRHRATCEKYGIARDSERYTTLLHRAHQLRNQRARQQEAGGVMLFSLGERRLHRRKLIGGER